MRGQRRRIGWPLWAGIPLAAAILLASCSSSNPPAGGEGPGTGFGDASVACAPGHPGCPCSTPGQKADCGEVTATDGNYVTCSEGTSTCQGGAWGPCIGQYTVYKSLGPLGGGIHTQGLGGTTPGPDAGSCGPCDPSCQTYVGDNSNGIDAGDTLMPTDAGGWTLPPHVLEGGVCQGLQCQVPYCGPGTTTAITGTVWDPAAINPVYNAVVMIPNGPVVPIPAGVSNDPCGGASLPPGVTYAYSDTSGHFTLTGVPVGKSIPLVIQLGRWRRTVTIDTSALTCAPQSKATNISAASGCADPHPGLNKYASTAGCVTRLPRVQGDGNIPHIAIATGGLDAIECMLYRMGVDSGEYTDETQSGRIHIFDDGGSKLASPNLNHDLSYLLGFGCPSGKCPAKVTTSTTGMTNPGFDTGNLNGWTTTGTLGTTYAANTNYWSTAGGHSMVLGTGQWYGSCVDSGTNTATQTKLVAPAGATSIDVDEYEECVAGSGSSAVVTLTDNTKSTTQTCQDCQFNTRWSCSLPVTPGDSYTLSLTNIQQPGSSYCTETFFDSVHWTTTPTVTPLLSNYDLVMLPCDGGGEYSSSNWGYSYNDVGRQNLVDYAGVGGRVFSSHWGREWIERPSFALPNGPFSNAANWIGDVSGGSVTGVIDTTKAYGQTFDTWMKAIGATTTNLITINPQREDTSSVTTNSRQFVYYKADNRPADFTFDTPVGSSMPVGRVMFTDMHLANGTPSGTFPGNCPTQGTALLQQEDAAEYLLFDLGACVTGLPIPGQALHYDPATFDRDFSASCPTGYRPVWRLFSYEDETPSDTNIVFTAYTADTLAQLGTQFPGVPLVTAQGPDTCNPVPGPSCMSRFVSIDVDPDLVAKGQASHAWLRVHMALNPSSDAHSAPVLDAWQQAYDCAPSE